MGSWNVDTMTGRNAEIVKYYTEDALTCALSKKLSETGPKLTISDKDINPSIAECEHRMVLELL